ncbi:MAG: AraC family transcriptional regulator [Planctomycetota bacterium]
MRFYYARLMIDYADLTDKLQIMAEQLLEVTRVALALYQEKSNRYRFRGERHRGLYEIFYLDRGRAFVRIGRKRFMAAAGECFLYPPGEFHQHQATKSQAPHYITLVFSVRGGAMLRELNRRCWPLPPRLRTLLARVVAEGSQIFAGVAMQRALLTEFLIEWLRHARALESDHERSSIQHASLESFREKSTDEVIAQALRYLEAHCCERLNMESVARAALISKSYLRQLAHARLGHSLRDELKILRMRRAKHLLSHTSQSIKEVARAIGYVNDAAFSRAFRSVEGATPSEYARTIAARGATPMPRYDN